MSVKSQLNRLNQAVSVAKAKDLPEDQTSLKNVISEVLLDTNMTWKRLEMIDNIVVERVQGAKSKRNIPTPADPPPNTAIAASDFAFKSVNIGAPISGQNRYRTELELLRELETKDKLIAECELIRRKKAQFGATTTQTFEP